MQTDLGECYRILEVPPGASQEEVKRAYRELVKVWHPDRFANDPKLQKKAQEKLKQINSAYEFVCNSGFAKPHADSAQTGQTSSGAEYHPRPPESNSSTKSKSSSPRNPVRQAPPPRRETHGGRRFVQVAILILVVATLKAVFWPNNSQRRSADTYPQPSRTYQSLQPEVTPSPAVVVAIAPDNPVPSMTTNAKVKQDYFTVGSTKAEVLTVQVASDSQRQSADTYPLSKRTDQSFQPAVTSSPDVVVVTAPDNPAPSVTTNAKVKQDYFTVGSTKDEVLTVQGTPDEFTASEFSYAYGSKVFFERDRVTSWRTSPTNPLKVKMIPVTAVEDRGYFTAGSTKDEVLTVQGTPDEFTADEFSYAYGSKVFFERDRVTSWKTSPTNPLKVKMIPVTAVKNHGYFTTGSTKDEVLTVQGTPDEFTADEFSYAYGSKVFFERDRVTSWKTSPTNPLRGRLKRVIWRVCGA